MFAITSRKAATGIATIGIASLGAYSYSSLRNVYAESDAAPRVFGRMNITSLPLHSTQDVSHNMKRLVFAFPEENARSGLGLTCMFISISNDIGDRP